MSFPRYPTYKNTGTDWLGEVPEHWSVNRFKLSVESCTNGVWGEEASNDENDVTCIRVADFDRHRLEARDPDEPTIRNVSDRDIEQRSLRKGDLLIEKSGGGEKQPVGAVVLYTGTTPAVCSNFVARMRLKRGLSPSFWRYAHHAAYSLRVNTKSIKQTSGIQNLDQQQYLDESAAYPSLDEQLAIAIFLDRETAKIDALIAEQKRLIELLQEKRQAVISHAVTKGLNPNSPMKESGVEWLGEVPKHWAISPIKYFARVGNGSTPNRDNLEYWADDGFPWLNSSVVNQTEVLEAERFVTKLALKECHLPIVKPPAALVGITGQGRTRGMAAQLMFTATVNQHVAFIMPSTNRITVDYLLRVLEASYDRLRLDSEGSGSTKGAITCEQLGLWCVPLPDHLEQEEIVSFLKLEVEMHESLKAESERAIQLLQERRSALISAAVTGQIDVRRLAEAEAGEQ